MTSKATRCVCGGEGYHRDGDSDRYWCHACQVVYLQKLFDAERGRWAAVMRALNPSQGVGDVAHIQTTMLAEIKRLQNGTPIVSFKDSRPDPGAKDHASVRAMVEECWRNKNHRTSMVTAVSHLLERVESERDPKAFVRGLLGKQTSEDMGNWPDEVL